VPGGRCPRAAACGDLLGELLPRLDQPLPVGVAAPGGPAVKVAGHPPDGPYQEAPSRDAVMVPEAEREDR
jgi:hypothetical protein